MRVELGGTGGPAGCGNPDQILGDNESLEGSDGPDVLIGDNGDNSFLGHLGADTFIGKGGNDFIDAADGQRDKAIDCGRRQATTTSSRTPIDPAASAAERTALDRSAKPSSPISGTKRQGPIVVGARARSPRRRNTVSMSASPAAIGTTRRPPVGELREQRRRRRRRGGVDRDRVERRPLGRRRRLPSPTTSSTLPTPSAASARAAAPRERSVALDADHRLAASASSTQAE